MGMGLLLLVEVVDPAACPTPDVATAAETDVVAPDVNDGSGLVVIVEEATAPDIKSLASTCS